VEGDLCPMTSEASGQLCCKEFGHLGRHLYTRIELTSAERELRQCESLKKKDGYRWRCILSRDHKHDHVYPVLPLSGWVL
jgi:hypothetical protein